MNVSKIIILGLLAGGIIGCDNSRNLASEKLENAVKSIENSPNILTVKNSTLPEYPPTLTVGQALDHWKGCSNPRWEKKSGDRGENQVVFKCDIENIKSDTMFRGLGFNPSKEEEKQYNQESIEAQKKLATVNLAVLFTMNTDATAFIVDSSALIFNFKDKKSYIKEKNLKSKYLGDASNPLNMVNMGILDSIYSNSPLEVSVSGEMYQNRQ